MDPANPPTQEPASDQPESQTALQDDLATLHPQWLHRTFLGLTGIAIAQALLLLQAASALLLYFAMRAAESAAATFLAWMPQVDHIAFAILWFSALYLLAAPGEHSQASPLSTPRKLLLIFGSASLLARAFPWLLFPTRAQHYLSGILSFLHLAAMTALLYYLIKLAQRTQDQYARRHLPLVLALIVLAQGFAIAVQMDIVRADDIRLALHITTTAYFLHLVLHMRKSLATSLFGFSSSNSVTSQASSAPSRTPTTR